MLPPRISIVTPSYNQGRFLGETLQSVLAQRQEIYEYFVLDGGSTDGSQEVIQRHEKELDFWTSERDGGQAAAIERGFRMATGDVLYWINSDDVLMPGAIASVKRAFMDPLRPEVVTGCDLLIDADSRIVRVRRPPRQTLAWARWGAIHVSQPTCFMRRTVYDSVGGLNLSLGCVLDTELWYRLLAIAPRWGYVDSCLAAFRVHDAQKGRSWLEQYAREHRWLEEHHPDFCARNLKHRVGVVAYRAKELLRGRYLRDAISTRSLRGKRVPGDAAKGEG
jgi:glycosyltransferase involved in cell wall biosynthesis